MELPIDGWIWQRPSLSMLHLPWPLLGTIKKRIGIIVSQSLHILLFLPALLSNPFRYSNYMKTPSLSNSSTLPREMGYILSFSCQLQMQLFTKFHVHFPSHRSIKAPIPSNSSSTTLLHSFTTSLAIQYQKSLEEMMRKLLISSFLLLLFLLHLCSKTSAQSSSSGPIDIIAVIGKAGKFTTFTGLLKSTQMEV